MPALTAADVDHIGVKSKHSTNMRTLHWVTKVGNLKTSLRFLELVLGMRVLRHEEFESGCEATCNGPYGGAWSKTMVGLGNENSNFVFELTYNYGIDGYTKGNDVQYFALAMPEAVPRAQALGYAITYEQGVPVILGPDSFRYKILESVAGREERFIAVALRSSDIGATQDYWCGVLGMSAFPTPPGLDSGPTGASLTVGWAAQQAYLHFIDIGDAAPVDHALAGGRIANSCRAVEPFYEAAKASGKGSIMNTPITLPTPGKADVVVTILADPDGYEICFVGDIGFYDLATPLYDRIDWGLRAARGGDGAEPPKPAEKLIAAEAMHVVKESSEVAKLSEASKLVVLDFGAAWCKNCSKLRPFCESLALRMGEVAFASVDIDEAEELVEEYGVTAVPHFVMLTGGKKVAEYVGSKEEALEASIAAAVTVNVA